MLKKIITFSLVLLITGCSNNLVQDSYITNGQIKPELFTNHLYNKLEKTVKKDGIEIDRNSSSVLVTIQDDLVFEKNSTVIKKDFFHTLDKISNAAISSNLSKLKIVSHSDDQGNYFDNITMTSEKALAFKNYFIQKGFRENKIVYYGVSSKQPLFDNDSDENRRKNRRIEIEIENTLK